jgi:hypothetical protein
MTEPSAEASAAEELPTSPPMATRPSLSVQ